MNRPAFIGSLNLTELITRAKEKHPSFKKADNGNIYVAVQIWTNEEPDEFGNDAKIQLNLPKDTEGKKWYVGNFKKFQPAENPIKDTDIPETDDLPF